MATTPARSQPLHGPSGLLGDLRGVAVAALATGSAAAALPLVVWSVVSPVLRGVGALPDGVPGTVRDLAVLAALVGLLLGSWRTVRRQEAAAYRSRYPDGPGAASAGDYPPVSTGRSGSAVQPE